MVAIGIEIGITGSRSLAPFCNELRRRYLASKEHFENLTNPSDLIWGQLGEKRASGAK